MKIGDLLDYKDVMAIFEINSRNTIYHWIKEYDFGKCKVDIPGSASVAARYDLVKVLKWARENERPTPGLSKWRERRDEQRRKRQGV